MRFIIFDVVFPIGMFVVAVLLMWLALTFNAKQQAVYTCEAVTYHALFFPPQTIDPPEWCEWVISEDKKGSE